MPWPCCGGQTAGSSLVTHQWIYTQRIGSVLATWSGHTNILSWPFLKYKKPFKIICRWGRLTKFIFGKCFADCGGQYKCVLLHTKELHVLPCEYVKITITKSTSLKQEAWWDERMTVKIPVGLRVFKRKELTYSTKAKNN